MATRLAFLLVVTTMASYGCATTSDDSRLARQLVEMHLQYFNNHDAAGLASAVTDDIKWISVTATEMTTETDGADALEAALAGYFGAIPDVQSHLEHIHAAGSFVVTRERVKWTDRTGNEQSQASYAVYEVKDGQIATVWYFAAEE